MDQSLTRKALALFALISIGICQQYFGGELRTKESYLYGRFEARFKSAQGDGLVSSFFTYQDERINGGHIWNEIDIEVLGRWENIINMNTITPGQSSHLREGYIENFTPHTEYYDYAFEWTPTYVAWFVNGEEYYRQDLPRHSYIATLKYAQKIMMNLWVPVYEDWVGKWNDDIIPRFAYYDHVAYYEYSPNGGDYGTDKAFKFKWRDDFDAFDSNRWEKATHGFSGNRVRFEPRNVIYKDGKMILCLTNDNAFGYQDTLPPKGLYGFSRNNIITIRFSEELDSASATNLSNYTINNVQINKIDLDRDKRTVHLHTSSLDRKKTYRVSISNIIDSFGNTQNNQILIINNTKPVDLPLKINVGGDSVRDYKADKFWWYDYEDYGHLNGNHQKVSSVDINDTSDDEVYQTSAERIAVYKIRLVPGIYDILLKFSENHYKANSRSFDIWVEGEKKVTALDVSKEVGMFTAYDKKLNYVSVADGILDIHFDLDLYGQGYAAAGPFLNGIVIDRTQGLGFEAVKPPETFALGELYPNPFNGTLTIPIFSSDNQNITIDIIDILGRKVVTLIDNQPFEKQSTVSWKTDQISSGIYFVRLSNSSDYRLKRVSLIK
ncbi:MAG: family 16 glycosylhydrolase [Candidatus Neomarinimicrobiota bacterium]